MFLTNDLLKVIENATYFIQWRVSKSILGKTLYRLFARKIKEIYEKGDLKMLVWLHIFLIVQDVGKVIEEWENTGWRLHTYSCAGNAALAFGRFNRVFSYFSLLIWCIRLLIVNSLYILITFCNYFGRENCTLSLFCRH